VVRELQTALGGTPAGAAGGICEVAAKAGTFRVMHQVRQWQESIALKNIHGATLNSHSRL
jgi:hypothetical protein